MDPGVSIDDGSSVGGSGSSVCTHPVGSVVCEKFVEIPEFCVGNFAVNLKREISRVLKVPRTPPPLATWHGGGGVDMTSAWIAV